VAEKKHPRRRLRHVPRWWPRRPTSWCRLGSMARRASSPPTTWARWCCSDSCGSAACMAMRSRPGARAALQDPGRNSHRCDRPRRRRRRPGCGDRDPRARTQKCRTPSNAGRRISSGSSRQRRFGSGAHALHVPLRAPLLVRRRRVTAPRPAGSSSLVPTPVGLGFRVFLLLLWGHRSAVSDPQVTETRVRREVHRALDHLVRLQLGDRRDGHQPVRGIFLGRRS